MSALVQSAAVQPMPDAAAADQDAAGVQVENWASEQRLTFESTTLGEQRRLYVRLPGGYHSSSKAYPVLYVLDGEFFFRQASAAVQFLSETRFIRNHPMPEAVVVGVVNQDRNRDFTPTHAPEQGTLRFPTSGQADRFVDFLEDEVFPLIEGRYRTQPYRIVAGWSLGGLFAVDTYLRHPDVFSAYLAISPSLWWDEDMELAQIESAVQAGALPSKPLVVTLGAEEGGDMDRTVRNGIKPLLSDARDANLAFEYIEVPGEGHTYVHYKAMLDGLRALYRSWVMPDSVSEAGMAAVTEFYEALSTRYGYPVRISEGAYFRVRVALVEQGREEEALHVAQQAVAEYPASSRARAGLGWTFLQMGDSLSARRGYEQAIALEEAMPEPDSELLLSYRRHLADLR
jgi:predicted alpha/beta superfamily hydrolase